VPRLLPSLEHSVRPRLWPLPMLLWFGLLPCPAQAPTPQPTPSPPPAPSTPAITPQDPQRPPATPPPAAPSGPASTAEGASQGPGGETPDKPETTDGDAVKKPPRVGIPVTDPVVHTHCVRCHALDDKQQMTRISFMRKSPEGWAESTKRMARLYGLQLSASDAKEVVRSLANSHGLTRSEAERGLYESERRVHWSEAHHDQDFRRACGECHPLGRVLLQQRDDEEWQLLRATHVAMFPLAQGQMGGGPPPDEEQQRRRNQGGGPGGATSAGGGGGGNQGGNAGGAANNAAGGGNNRGGRGGDGDGNQNVGDRVLQKLAKDQPLITSDWSSWQKNRRAVPLAGTWSVVGHEIGRGELLGTATITRTDTDEYTVRWQLRAGDGSTIVRSGKGLLYAGYSWRGRSQDEGAGENAPSWREVLLLDDGWQTLKGRLFTGHYDELGADVTLHRDLGRPRVLAVGNRAIPVPSSGHRLELHGEGLPATLSAEDFFVGDGLTITGVERRSDRLCVLTVDAAAGSEPGGELGTRGVAFGSDPHSVPVVLYDTVDYVRIRPLQGLARIGGQKHPKQVERFEAVAMHQGPDGKPYTDDDVDLFLVRPRWALAEFRVRENDDDLQYVGSLDAATGVFTPNVDGPNPARKWQANNVGDVFVTATVELTVAVRPEPPKPPATEKTENADKPAEEPKPAVAKPEVPAGPPVMVKKTFQARSHLLVTVPLYARWQALDWEER
jgi:quinohemoprotein amine dehydrogenase